MYPGCRAALFVAACLAFLALAPAVFADEGMWLFNKPPTEYLKKQYGFDAAKQWLDHVQKSSVRFNNGGSGSFVSPDGLVMTNHHIGADAIQKIDDDNKAAGKETHYMRDGFCARTPQEEIKTLDLELNVLMDIKDVTERVNAAVKSDMKPAEAAGARRAVMAEIEQESLNATGLRSDVVTLYQGGVYNLYLYKKYTDVRLVFAPEEQAAFFGGDPDNFEYPRFDMDICFFRAYEDGKPVHPENYLKWSKNGVKDGELVFVSGHPGGTERMNTVASLDELRDVETPFTLQRLFRTEVTLGTFAGRSAENARVAREDFFSIQNSRKAYIGRMAALLDPALMGRKKGAEQALRSAAAKGDKLKSAADAWDRIAQIEKTRAALIRRYTLLENPRYTTGRSIAAFPTPYFSIARFLVRAAQELPKKSPDRLREFRDSALDELKLQLFSDAKLSDDYEIVKLTDGLTFLVETLGYDDPLVQKVLDGKTPHDRAYEAISGTQLRNVDFRKKLYDGGEQALQEAKDPMIALAAVVDPAAREVRKRMETEVDEPRRTAYAEIAKAKFAVEGTNTYPDATFTLRLSFGVVKGYEENGKHVPFETTFEGLYQRSAQNNDKPPFDLPKRWVDNKSKLDLRTPLNFICTADIIGGNSGSPVVNRDAELVGIIFDGNIQSLALDFAYSEEQARAVSVCSQGIVEALRKVYDADKLADEITGRP
ncbi:MAG TPA: S46 family peptidase [Gemmataceae bacterium]|nr:S46 family peptidase [Gemmataceae bacterium]